MSEKFIKYNHHGKEVWVNKDLKGKHKDHCLCFSCENFKPNQADNCEIAEENYSLCKKHNLVLPVYECPEFTEGMPDYSEYDSSKPVVAESKSQYRRLKHQVGEENVVMEDNKDGK